MQLQYLGDQNQNRSKNKNSKCEMLNNFHKRRTMYIALFIRSAKVSISAANSEFSILIQ